MNAHAVGWKRCFVDPTVTLTSTGRAVVPVARAGSGAAAAERAVQSGLDRVGDVRVVAQILRHVLQRLLVARRLVLAVDRAVVEPVVDHPLPARLARCRGGRRRHESCRDTRHEGEQGERHGGWSKGHSYGESTAVTRSVTVGHEAPVIPE